MVSETPVPACPGHCDHGCARTYHVDVVVRRWAYSDNGWREPWHTSRDLYHFHFRFFHVRLGCADTHYEFDLGRSIADSGSAAPLRCCNRHSYAAAKHQRFVGSARATSTRCRTSSRAAPPLPPHSPAPPRPSSFTTRQRSANSRNRPSAPPMLTIENARSRPRRLPPQIPDLAGRLLKP